MDDRLTYRCLNAVLRDYARFGRLLAHGTNARSFHGNS